MSRITRVAVALGVAGALAAAVPAAARTRLPVVASVYPVAWAAEQVGGRRVAVENLTPAGAEPHDIELSTDQRDAVEDAAVAFVFGEGIPAGGRGRRRPARRPDCDVARPQSHRPRAVVGPPRVARSGAA